MSHELELLAPAGDWDSFIAAVENGADAVYIGGRLFSARQYASNFDIDEISKAVRYAHIRGAKIYITVNTLLDRTELPVALEFVRNLYNVGVDAIIIQDLGLIYLIRNLLGDVELHGSTQMTIHNSDGAELLKSLGLTRVVLAREMSLPEIETIKNAVDIEIEIFIHGALCICYSGQCLMSSLIGGRSGNRGRCAQPCRQEYELIELDTGNTMSSGHLLSPKDLCTVDLVEKFNDIGIESLKIEGRMKRPEYVATVTKAYREAIDGVESDDNGLTAVFNRGMTTAYLLDDPGNEMMSYSRPSNRGKYLGRVLSYSRDTQLVQIALEDKLSVGDGFEVWVTDGGRVATVARAISVGGREVPSANSGDKAEVKAVGKIRKGDRVFKTRDDELLSKAQETFKSPKTTRKIPIEASVSGKLGSNLHISFKDADGLRGEADTEALLENAKVKPLGYDYLLTQLNRLGNTPFTIGNFSYELADGLIVPVSQINDARRRALDSLEEARFRARTRNTRLRNVSMDYVKDIPLSQSFDVPKSVSSPYISVVVGDITSALAAVKAGASRICLNMVSRRMFTNKLSLEPLVEALSSQGKPSAIFVKPSRILRDTEIVSTIEKLKRLQEDIELSGIYVGNLGLLRRLVDEFRGGTRLPIILDSPLGIFNEYAAASLIGISEGAASGLVVSHELNLDQLKVFTARVPIPVEVLVQGTIESMVSEHCFISSTLGSGIKNECTGFCMKGRYGFRDKTGAVFPVYGDPSCRGHIANSRELCMIEHVRELAKIGIKGFEIDATYKDQSYVELAASVYADELKALTDLADSYEPDRSKRRLLEGLSYQGVTKGHYFRGVINTDG